MSTEHEIKSEKILVKDIFSTMWFRIPEYQRPYIWGKDEITELLDDLVFALTEKPDQEYFLGSFVFQSKKANPAMGQMFNENDLLDGQQRMTTLLMLFACIRDLARGEDEATTCTGAIFQKGNKIDHIPERTRIVFAIRESVQAFVDEFVKTGGGTTREADLQRLADTSDDPSLPNMARALLQMRRYLTSPENQLPGLTDLLIFLRNKVLMIYVSTEDLDDAFRLFTILNDRGVPLRNSDILKAMNLGALDTAKPAERARYAKLWEDAEGELGEDFDRFLNYLRTILVKEKARLNLLQEFEDKIYEPKEKDKSTGQKKPALLAKGRATFDLVERYLRHYNRLLGQNNYDETGGSFQFDNLIKVMLYGLPSTDWIPPLLRYFDRFQHERLLEFLMRLDNKFSADWVSGYTPTERIDKMNAVIKVVEAPEMTPASILTNDCFTIDGEAFINIADSAVYGRRFTRYLLLKLDYLYQDHSHRMSMESLSIEHVLPQNPADGSQWKQDFTDAEREEWTNRLGNLVLISSRKNPSQGRADYAEKKRRYFSRIITTCPNSLRVIQAPRWTPAELTGNHRDVLQKLRQHYALGA
jgi:hypothetical protein